jgi:hypothetical protein
VYFFLTRIDLVVHVQLYNFGLMFSPEWVNPYRTYMWLIYGSLLAPVVLTSAFLLSGLARWKPQTINEPYGTKTQRSHRSVLRNSKYKMLMILVSLTVAGTVYFLLTRVDLIVHGQLYIFGLVYNNAWAEPYRLYMWSIYGCLLAPVAVNSMALASGFVKVKRKAQRKPVQIEIPQKVVVEPLVSAKSQQKSEQVSERCKGLSETKLAPGPDFEKRAQDAPKPSKKEQSVHAEVLKVEAELEKPKVVSTPQRNKLQVDIGGVICPNCKKMFHRPLVMLDFSAGRTRLVNVCPYCNQVVRGVESEPGVIIDSNLVDKVVKYGESQDRRM